MFESGRVPSARWLRRCMLSSVCSSCLISSLHRNILYPSKKHSCGVRYPSLFRGRVLSWAAIASNFRENVRQGHHDPDRRDLDALDLERVGDDGPDGSRPLEGHVAESGIAPRRYQGLAGTIGPPTPIVPVFFVPTADPIHHSPFDILYFLRAPIARRIARPEQ